WTINVVGLAGPHTEHVVGTPGGEFFLHPRTSSFEFGAWDVTGGRAIEDPVLVAGHEMCGHGALLERDIHPDSSIERVDTDVHDPTVNVENAILSEQGITKADRGLAADAHRGESFGSITIRNYPFNGTSIPAGERPKIQLAKDFIRASNTWVDILGHSDRVGSLSAKQDVSQERADKVKHALTHGTRPVTGTISETFTNTGAAGTGTLTVSGDRFTNVEGRSDFDAAPGVPDPDLRRVQIIMSGRPAGAEVPNTGTPTAIDPVGPRSIRSFIRRRFFGNACDRLLARTAWF
ncbi:MAG TPA: hypothetical protein VJS66_04865, partial [Burkholderiales bacterium]|nr:hypothetical protein [Burkholderiales bacterium]